MKLHWHLGYSNKTACGMLAYPTEMTEEYDTPGGRRIEGAVHHLKVSCLRCQKVMLLGRWAPPATKEI